MLNPAPTPAPLIDRGALERALRGDVTAVKAFREALKSASDQLGERFRRNEAIEALVAGRAQVVDEVILASWIHFAEQILASADLVTIFGEDTPLELIRALRPDVLIKGADYTRATVVGGDVVEGYGGRVVLADLVPSFSTTATITALKGARSVS